MDSFLGAGIVSANNSLNTLALSQHYANWVMAAQMQQVGFPPRMLPPIPPEIQKQLLLKPLPANGKIENGHQKEMETKSMEKSNGNLNGGVSPARRVVSPDSTKESRDVDE